MAEVKKYLDTTALGTLVDQIKAEDAKVKAYADAQIEAAGKTYDVAGAAATAKTEAIAAAKTETEAQVKALADGAVKTNADAIAAIKDDANIDSFADVVAELAKKQATGDYATKAEAKGYADAKDDAIAAAKAAADAAQEDATANAEAIAAINNTESGILAQAKGYTDTEVAEVQGSVNALAGKVGTVPEGSTVMGIIENIQENAYDDSEIQGKIDAVSGKVTTLVGEDAGKSVRTIANEELAAQLIAEGAAESLDTLQEIAAWIQAHPDDASAMNKAIEDLEGLVGTLPEGVTATTIVGYIQEAVAAEKARAEEAEGDLGDRIATLEGKFGGADGSVEDMIADAKQEAIDAAAGDATTKANKALEDAKAYADAEDAKIESRVDALEAIDHEHKNFDLLETYTQTEANLADAVAKKHEHAHMDVLEGITADLVAKWNAAEQNAKTYADGLNTTMQSTVDGIDARVTANANAIALKAAQADLEAAVERIADNETAIAANTSAINSFTAITSDEVTALFA